MLPRTFTNRFISVPDLVILLCVATAIYGVVAIGNQWRAEFHPITEISLSAWSLPYYTLLSGIRGFTAYTISLLFTLVVGYLAARSPRAERIIIPLLDILQSIPVLGFLPGLVIGLVALFPRTNIGLELAAVLMIFTGQVWNMTFSYYASLKSIPSEFMEASTVMGLSRFEKLKRVELPYSAVNLAWNSLLSMAGGWFFLIPCEAMTLGDHEYRLPGIGAYMDVAVKSGNIRATIMAVIAMILLIVLSDFLVWRPILAWVQKFRLEDIPGTQSTAPLMQIWIRESKLISWLSILFARITTQRKLETAENPEILQRTEDTGWLRSQLATKESPKEILELRAQLLTNQVRKSASSVKRTLGSPLFLRGVEFAIYAALLALVLLGASKLIGILVLVSPGTWISLVRDTLWTLLRVTLALILSTLWTVPVGIWIGTSAKRIRLAQPMIQILASFPAPMLYPLALGLFFALGITFDWAAMLLMQIGVQWYILFNVMAGAIRIPHELRNALALMETSRWDVWKTLYLPSIFPNLVTGWITAAGGAWNASVVAEYLPYYGKILRTGGLGADLSVATVDQNFQMLAASLTVMVFVVVVLNRTVWSQLSRLAQTRYRMEQSL